MDYVESYIQETFIAAIEQTSINGYGNYHISATKDIYSILN
jgi:hypothetical protein